MHGSTSLSASPAPRPPLLINRTFALLWIGQSISNIGDFVFETTLILWIATRIGHGQPWAPLAVSGVVLATSLPTVLVGPLAGVFVDRWDRRRTMLQMDAVRFALILLLVPAALGEVPGTSMRLAAIYGVVALATVCAQFFSPARLALLGDVVEDPLQARASGLSQMTTMLALILGPPLAALLVFTVGVEWALLLNALSFAVSFLAVLAAGAVSGGAVVVSGQPRDFLREFRTGLRFYAGNRVLMTLLVAGVIIMLGAGSINALDIFFATQNLHASASLYGILGASIGAGAVCGAALASIFAQRIGVGRMFWVAVLACGVGILVYARMTSFVPAVAVLFLVGIPMAALNVAFQPLILLVTPRELVGRVTAVVQPAVSLATMASVIVAGYLDSTLLHGFHARALGMSFGPVDTIFTAAGVLGVIAGVYAAINLRHGLIPLSPSREAGEVA